MYGSNEVFKNYITGLESDLGRYVFSIESNPIPKLSLFVEFSKLMKINLKNYRLCGFGIKRYRELV